MMNDWATEALSAVRDVPVAPTTTQQSSISQALGSCISGSSDLDMMGFYLSVVSSFGSSVVTLFFKME